MLVDVVSVIVRTLGFIALFQATGAAIFVVVLGETLPGESRQRLLKLVVWSGAAAIVLTTAHFALEPARMGGEFAAVADPVLLTILIRSPQAVAAGWKVLGLAVLVAGISRRTRGGGIAAMLGASLVFAAFTQVGHTSVPPSKAVLSSLLWVHLAIGAFWFGSLIPLLLISKHECPALAATAVEKFSKMAVWLVPALGVAGLAMAVVLLGSFRALATPYGGVLLFKGTVFAILIGLAALNRWQFGPALADGHARARRAFARMAAAEYALIVLILGATALLTSLLSPES